MGWAARLVSGLGIAGVLLYLMFASSSIAHRVDLRLQQEEEFSKEFTKLQHYALKAMREGADAQVQQQFAEVLTFFRRGGEPAARFLVEQLNSMNSAELEFLRQPGSTVEEWLGEGAAKPYVCLLLAELFSVSSADMQERILESLKNSYTPSEEYKEAIQFLNIALWRIGAPAMPTILELANHDSQFVRCSVAKNLNDLREDFLHRNDVRISPSDFPLIDCQDSGRERTKKLRAWARSWERYKNTLSFPKIPSLLDDFIKREGRWIDSL
jgi:hypothetical protein